MRRIRTYRDVAEPGAEDIVRQVERQGTRLADRLAAVGRVIMVASGKGGVGKSAIAANVAAALAASGLRVGAADADLNGPSLARMLGAAGPLAMGTEGVLPAIGAAGVRVMSMDLLLEAPDAPLRWQGEGVGAVHQSVLETSALREFLADTAWGALDALVVDLPPGTDKLDRLLELVPRPDALALVTTPSAMAGRVVARSVRAARGAGIEELGLVANMAGWRCPGCGRDEPLFSADGARELAAAAGLPLWAEIPFDPGLALATDAGRPYVLEAPAAPAAVALTALSGRLAGNA